MKGWGDMTETKEPAPELGKGARPDWARGEKREGAGEEEGGA